MTESSSVEISSPSKLLCKLCGEAVVKLIYGKCQPCVNAYKRAWNARNRERVRGYSKWGDLTPAQKARKKVTQRRNYLLRKYGLTEEQVDALKQLHGDNCAICGREKPFARWRYELVIDHCHLTGVVRGFLCNRCNAHLGWYEEHAKNIVDYLS